MSDTRRFAQVAARELTFVDTNVFMYAVGAPHAHRDDARAVFSEAAARGEVLVTSAEVLQELLHVNLARGRPHAADAALQLVGGLGLPVWSLDSTDVVVARLLARSHAALSARDLLHLACCQRRGVFRIRTFDRCLGAAFPEWA